MPRFNMPLDGGCYLAIIRKCMKYVDIENCKNKCIRESVEIRNA